MHPETILFETESVAIKLNLQNWWSIPTSLSIMCRHVTYERLNYSGHRKYYKYQQNTQRIYISNCSGFVILLVNRCCFWLDIVIISYSESLITCTFVIQSGLFAIPSEFWSQAAVFPFSAAIKIKKQQQQMQQEGIIQRICLFHVCTTISSHLYLCNLSQHEQ